MGFENTGDVADDKYNTISSRKTPENGYAPRETEPYDLSGRGTGEGLFSSLAPQSNQAGKFAKEVVREQLAGGQKPEWPTP